MCSRCNPSDMVKSHVYLDIIFWIRPYYSYYSWLDYKPRGLRIIPLCKFHFCDQLQTQSMLVFSPASRPINLGQISFYSEVNGDRCLPTSVYEEFRGILREKQDKSLLREMLYCCTCGWSVVNAPNLLLTSNCMHEAGFYNRFDFKIHVIAF